MEKLSRDVGTDGRREERKERRREGGAGRAGKGGGTAGSGWREQSQEETVTTLAGWPATPPHQGPVSALTQLGRVQPAPSSTAPCRPFKKVGEGSTARFRPPPS